MLRGSMNVKLLLALALIAVFSGCVGQSKVDPNNGLVVNQFSVDPSTAEAGDAVRFFIDVENVGGTTARCITTELFGVDSWYDELGQQISLLQPFIPTRGLSFNWFDGIFNLCYTDITLGRVCAGGDTRTGDYGVSGFIGSNFLDFSNNFCGSMLSSDPRFYLVKHRPELMPPNPALGRPGQSFTAEWILRPPPLPEGVELTYPITARTSYFYETNSVMRLDMFSRSEFKRRTDLGQQTASPLVMQNTFGSPLHIIATSGSSPIVVSPDSQLETVQYESYRFEIVNTGNGFPLPFSHGGYESTSFNNPNTQSGFVVATMKVSGPGVAFYDCLGQSGTEIVIPTNVLTDLVRIRSDQTVPIACTLAIDRTVWQNKPLGSATIEFNLWYRYYVDSTVNVRVRGVEGLSGREAIRGV